MHKQENESNRKADRLRIGERSERQRCENPRHPQDAAGIAEDGIHQEDGQQAPLSPERVLHRTIAVTNRHLCSRPFLQQMETVLAARPHAVILREKDLLESEYRALARKLIPLCEGAGVPCYLHGHYLEVACQLGCPNIHLGIAQLQALHNTERNEGGNPLAAFERISVSCHSVPEALLACDLGATSIVLGTIFETDCKPGKQGAGLDFLRQVCRAVNAPVFAIGGITPARMPDVLGSGAAGGCMMSWFMRLPSPVQRSCHRPLP